MSSRTGRSDDSASPATNPVLVGTVIVVLLIVGVFLSYNANKGLPFVKTFPMKAKVPDAAELVVGSEVRIGGFRVGQVNKITAEPPTDNTPPYALIDMALDADVKIPSDTIVRVRPRSLLGSKYVELQPGDAKSYVKRDATLPLGQALPAPELDEAFNTFDAQTRKGLQGTLRGFGDAVAGRGDDINRTIVATDKLMPALQRVVTLLADPKTDLDGFVRGAASFSGALAPVANTIGELLDNGAITLRALDAGGSALGEGIEALPPTEIAAAKTLTDTRPVLHDLAAIVVALRGPARQLPQTTNYLAHALDTGTRVLNQSRPVTPLITKALSTLGRVSRDPAAAQSLVKLDGTVNALRPTLQLLEPAQRVCNTLGILARNFGSTVSKGDQSGTWLTFYPILRLEQSSHAAVPDADLHVDTTPTENATECEAGNEPYTPGQFIGHPAGLQPTTTELTSSPPGVIK